MLQTRDWHGIMIFASADKKYRASTQCRAGCSVANIVPAPEDPTRLKVHLVQEANINPVLIHKPFHFQLPATDTVSIPRGEP
jgi:hypothetical protein